VSVSDCAEGEFFFDFAGKWGGNGAGGGESDASIFAWAIGKLAAEKS
jgi:hypothetical protein